MTSIINKSKENATINKTVKDSTVTIEVVGSKKKTVRPIMTVEARDALNKFHESTGLENRSDSILALTSLPSDHSFLSRETTRLTEECFDLSLGKGRIKGNLTKAKKEAQQWKLIAWSMTAACIALAATMMITAS